MVDVELPFPATHQLHKKERWQSGTNPSIFFDEVDAVVYVLAMLGIEKDDAAVFLKLLDR